jgi:hypothetical protein
MSHEVIEQKKSLCQFFWIGYGCQIQYGGQVKDPLCDLQKKGATNMSSNSKCVHDVLIST